MQMRCCAREAGILVLCIGQLLHSSKPLLVNGDAVSNNKSPRNTIQVDGDLQRNADDRLLYRKEQSNGTETILHHNREPRSSVSHRQKKRKSRPKKKIKSKSGVVPDSLKMKPKPAVNSNAGVSNGEDLAERASLNWPIKAMRDVGKKIGNHMAGSSQIGDRQYHTVIKPTVVVNYHGAVKYGRNRGKLGKSGDAYREVESSGENLIHINQEVNFGPPHGLVAVGGSGMKNKTKQSARRYFPKEHFYFRYT